ncbi:MAG: DUF3883 domain-containing protein [Phycisphaerae bacterium]|nr:DUF3883 domain-containing protein [Phycisphaerae bacterium]
MKLPASLVDKHTPLDNGQFTKVRDQQIRPSLDRTGLHLLREKAGRERDLRELYRGRAPYELLQNADDAGATHAIFMLLPDGLVFIHSGLWFTVENFLSLVDGWSDKDPNQCIGHKGLGFRSVLDITPAPHVLKVDGSGFFGFKFTWALNKGHIDNIFLKHPDLKADYAKWTKYGQLACPVMAIPGAVKKSSLDVSRIYDRVTQGDFGRGFSTMFWFPAKDREADRKLIQELDVIPLVSDAEGRDRLLGFLQEVAILLPFLSNVATVELYDGDSLLGKAHIDGKREEPGGDEICVSLESDGSSRTTTFFQMHRLSAIPLEVRNDTQTPRAVRQMREAEVRLSVLVRNGQPVSEVPPRFHVYFPTEESTGLGVLVHGDFYVKPDRTRLMPGKYNEWLLNEAAKLYAGGFLTRLLNRYGARNVFEAIRPAEPATTEASKALVAACGEALKRRREPFVPTHDGLVALQEVLMPPMPDAAGFWHSHFSDLITFVSPGKRSFLSPTADSAQAREFLGYAGLDPLPPALLLDFIEAGGGSGRPAAWWYDCYEHLYEGRNVPQWPVSDLAGRSLIPGADLAPLEVPSDASLTVCLPPDDAISSINVPKCFAHTFVFVSREVAQMLRGGADDLRKWVLDALKISRFEATDLVPRAIRSNVQDLYSGAIAVAPTDLSELWVFLERIISASRGILSTDFWRDVGRLPVPMVSATTENYHLSPQSLVPAFLAYWPDDGGMASNSLAGVTSMRRVSVDFVDRLVAAGTATSEKWRDFFGKSGISSNPKRLRYSRIVGEGNEIHFTEGAALTASTAAFSGDRQRDENQVVIENLSLDRDLWDDWVRASGDSEGGRTLQSVAIVDGFAQCVETALAEFQSGGPTWRDRLSSLAASLTIDAEEPDKAFRRAGGGGGASEPVASYLSLQMDRYSWVATSCGPRSRRESFVRLASRRLISRGSTDEELGDHLIPYVVAATLEDCVTFQGMGVEPLDDAGSATPDALIRALQILGAHLSEDSGKSEVLKVRGRWRRVRGAIQEIYRVLNHTDGLPGIPSDIRLAARAEGEMTFLPRPLYYAEPGSPIERAFQDVLPLFDADRPYQSLFSALGVIRLTPRQNIEETFCANDRAVPSSRLLDEILNKLAPHLLAGVIAKSEEQDHRNRVLRRLRDRFDVKVADRLTVSFKLTKEPFVERAVDFSKFYLQQRVVEGAGAIREMHYTLYVAGPDDIALNELDGDALGASLAPLFLDGAGSDDLAGFFPRVVTRFLSVEGDERKMQEFLYQHLGVSMAAQETARDDVTGRSEEAPPITSPPPPARLVLHPSTTGAGAKMDFKDEIEKHREPMERSVDRILGDLAKATADHQTSRDAGGQTGGTARPVITREQEARGRRGEEEFLRRLRLPGGWEGFSLVEDTRSHGCGYDFLCIYGGRQVKVEVKTFARNGRVVVTYGELREAAQSRDDYYLLGFLDEGPPEAWQSAVLADPVPALMEKGQFQVDTKLEVHVGNIFDIFGND